MLAADRIIDMGPDLGLTAEESFLTVLLRKLRRLKTLTGKYLSGAFAHQQEKSAKVNVVGDALVLLGAKEHNLKKISISVFL